MELTLLLKLTSEGNEAGTNGSVQKQIEKKLEKIETRWGKSVTARAVVEELTAGYDCTLTVTLHGSPELVSHSHGETLIKSVDEAGDKLIRQFEAEADKRQGRERQRRTPVPGKEVIG